MATLAPLSLAGRISFVAPVFAAVISISLLAALAAALRARSVKHDDNAVLSEAYRSLL
jgi:hypothetical protein